MAKEEVYAALGSLTGLKVSDILPTEKRTEECTEHVLVEPHAAPNRPTGYVPPHLCPRQKPSTSTYSNSTQRVSLSEDTSGTTSAELSVSTRGVTDSDGDSSKNEIQFDENVMSVVSQCSRPVTRGRESAVSKSTPSEIPPGIDIKFTPRRPQYGVHFIKMGPESRYVNVQFIDCVFDETSPTVFSNCSLVNVTFKDCACRGWKFVNVVMRGNGLSDCTFKDSHWTNRVHALGYNYREQSFTAFKSGKYPEELGEEDWEKKQREEREHQESCRRFQEENGWGVPEGFEHGRLDDLASPPLPFNPRDNQHRLPASGDILFDNTPTRGVDFKIGSGELYERVTFQDCTFENVIFENCFFRGASFEGCKFNNIHLTNVVLTRICYEDCEFNGFKWANRSLMSNQPLRNKTYVRKDNFVGPRTPQQILDQADERFRRENELVSAIDQASKAPTMTRERAVVPRGPPPKALQAYGKDGSRRNVKKKTPEDLIRERLKPGQRHVVEAKPSTGNVVGTCFAAFEFI